MSSLSPSSTPTSADDGGRVGGAGAVVPLTNSDTTNREEGVDDDEGLLLANLTLDDIVEETRSDRGLPIAKFVDDVQKFSDSFEPVPATAEHMIGAYNQLHARYRQHEHTFRQKMGRLHEKIPELEKSIALVSYLDHARERAQARTTKEGVDDNNNGAAVCTVRYSVADNVYGRADVNANDGHVNLWLGANVMLEYTYEDALAFLRTNLSNARRDVQQLREDLGLVRDQIVTCEVTMSRIYNWDVRRRRQAPPPPPAVAGAEEATVGLAAS